MKPRLLSLLGVASMLAIVAYGGGVMSPATQATAVSRAPKLRSPIRLAQLENGHVLIADYYQQQIIECKPKGLAELRSIPIAGNPLAVAYHSDRIYVGNETTRRVEVYDQRGKKLHDLGGSSEEFEKPTDIAIDGNLGRIFVVDGLAAEVRMFNVGTDPTGVLVGTIPATGSPIDLHHPTGIAVDPLTSEVLLSDFGDPNLFVDPAVLVFDYQGNLLNTLSGSSGLLGERFSRPQGLALRGSRVYLVDSWLGRVFILDRMTGTMLAALGDYGSGPGELDLPLDVLLDEGSDDVYVTNYQNRRIEQFVNGAMVP